MDTKQAYLNNLIDILIERFSLEELKLFAFKLGIKELSGPTKEKIAMELIAQLDRHQHLLDLIVIGKKDRPDIDWPIPPWIKTEWIETARRMERNQAYDEAIAQWQKIQTFDPQLSTINQEIQRLNDKIARNDRIITLQKQLFQRKLEIKSIYLAVASHLNRLEKENIDETAEIILATIAEFLAGETTAPEFIDFWRGGIDIQPTPTVEMPNYQALAGRLQRGEIVVFLGADAPAAFNQVIPTTAELVPQLANCANYPEFQGSLPELCEYLDMNNQYGRNFLRLKLQELVDTPITTPILLHQLLASIPTPLLIISSCINELLEQACRQQGKNFVLLSHAVEAIGTLRLEYSHQDKVECCSTEDLSGLQLLEQGYSLIYKILGCFSLSKPLNINQRDSLMLSEQDYFTFARYTDKLIPNYVVRQLTGRGCWLLGHYLHSWENRLLVEAILTKRRYEEQALTVHKAADNFAKVFWENARVKNYPIDLQEFIENLQRYL
jgi:hypothetical protein